MRRLGRIAAVVLLLATAFGGGWAATRAPEVTGGLFLGRGHPDRPPSLLDQVREELVSGYYRPVDSAVLAQPTVAEMLAALDDPHTDYLSPREYQKLRDRVAQSYSGVGLRVGRAKEGLRVTSAPAGPARAAGIRRGDVIVSVNGRATSDLPFRRSLALIKGKSRTSVRLTVERPDVGIMEFTVVRREIQLPALRSRLLSTRGTRVGHVRLLSFRGNTAERLERRVRTLVAEGAKGIVLDLRGNPGGLLDQAVAATSLFVEEGIVCTTAGREKRGDVYRAVGEATYERLPLVVVVDRGTASAAEVLAAALRDHRRAVVVGERTYGKASVQSVRELSNGGALKITTATYRTPTGRDLEHRGVHPRIVARDDGRTRADEALAVAKAALLAEIAS